MGCKDCNDNGNCEHSGGYGRLPYDEKEFVAISKPTSGWNVGDRVRCPSTEESGEVIEVRFNHLLVKLDKVGTKILFEPKYLEREYLG